MVSVAGLRKTYGSDVVLDGVDFDVAAGSVLALLGANGAGKTTTVRILATLLRPDDGEVASPASTSPARPSLCAASSASPVSTLLSTSSRPAGRTCG